MLSQPDTAVATVLLLASFFSSVFLGGLVLTRNPWKRTHRSFAVLTFNIALWALGVLLIVHSHTEAAASFWIVGTFMVAAFLPGAFYQFITYFPFQRFQGSRVVLGLLYGGATVVSIGTFTPWYLIRLEVYPDGPPVVEYGPVFLGLIVIVGLAFIASTANLARKLPQTSGVQRRQTEHVVVAFYSATILATLTNVAAPALGIGGTELYGPCFMVLMMAGLAYSMVRYHLLDIRGLVSRTTVYAVVTAFVIATFLCAVSLVHWVFEVGERNNLLTTGLAALVVAVVIQPLKERVQLLMDRLILHRRYDANALVERLSRSAAQFVNLPELLERIAHDLRHTLGVRALRVMLVDDKDPRQLTTEYTTYPEALQLNTATLDRIMEYCREYDDPVVLEELLLRRVTPRRAQLATILAEIDAHLLVPLKTTSGVVGIITLGEKTSREMYTRDDIGVFNTFAGSLATAIENARLYNRLEALNLHLERIMSSMRGGVIAVDENGYITTVNDEARELLGAVQPGMGLDEIEINIAEVLRQTLRRRRGISDLEMTILRENEEGIPVAVSSSCFDAPGGDSYGAVALLYNMTQIRRLEQNVQRADRLTSIGTMAAGMAHEIKNPLQSIKTFSQLLLERYEDDDFRKTFAEVVPPEVQRIDTIVTRLLHFARPKPVCFAPQDLAHIIHDVLALVENQLRKQHIDVATEFPDDLEPVRADDQQLHQVFLNLVLNAIDAMTPGPERTLRIRVYYDRTHVSRRGQMPLLDVKCVKVALSDTGCGIPETHIKQLFTPFFTTKDEGSGLGLSVVHRIIAEHEGDIDVQSSVGEGTTFLLTFPLLEAPTAAKVKT